ncbi:pectinesterase [Pseudomassariella vexata]|uniref:Pectinesterase n=1 Tax=Pseudomassariella vexata TaxID=1141098 RepID=A0A1Y2E0U6_9PEZI|nr:pectinesterase [Pseudomassariella vexata]ORY64485.1 pectinesterase [Pseudomassariella vexata]
MWAQVLMTLAFAMPNIVAASGTNCSGTYARTIPPQGSLVVDATDEYPESFSSVSAAVANLNNATTDQQTIFILPGVYSEQVYIPFLDGPLIIQGYTCDTRSYASNFATLTGNLSRQTPNITNNDGTATLRLWSANVKVYNLNIANTFGEALSNGQALALSAQATNQGFYGCNFTGYQDTIYANEGRQIYAKSYINGAIDFIFGQRAAAWFEGCDIETIGNGYITANGREAENNTSFYVFNSCAVNGTSGVNSTYLGRPWRPYSRVVFQESHLEDVVSPEGWVRWDDTQSLDNVYYREFGNMGPGAAGPRANFTASLDEPVRLAEVLGDGFESEWWVHMDYL